MDTQLLKKQMTAAYQYSYVRLILNCYTLLEMIEEESHVSQNISDCCLRFHNILSKYYSGEDVVEETLRLRDDMIGKVEVIVSYMDCFSIYEYVLNRMKGRFRTLPESPIDDETFVNYLMAFITESSDMGVVNRRIKTVIGQLPICLTKQKFSNFVMEGLSVYIGSSKGILMDMMDTLRTESMVQLPEGMSQGYEIFYELLEEVKSMDYKHVNSEEFEEIMVRFLTAYKYLVEESGFYVSLQEIINDFCVILLSGKDAMVPRREEEFYSSMIKEILEHFQKEDMVSDLEEFSLKLSQLEGKQEVYYERYLKAELPRGNEELNNDSDYIRAVNIERLLSGSSFARLIDSLSKEESEELVDRISLEKEVGIYLKELEEVFATSSKSVVRAIMAKVLSNLPVSFGSMKEIEAYIRGSLLSCMNDGEKETCKELLKELIDDEYYMV